MVMRAYRNGDDPTAGMARLRQALDSIDLSPHSADKVLPARAYFALGMGYRTQGDEQQAVACFKTALAYMPSFAPARLAQQV
jgi:Tfp pilus assembly protein PilF